MVKLYKRIGIDIDGVITDIGSGLEKLLSQRLNRVVKKDEITNYDLKHMGVDSSELNKIFNHEFYKNLPVIENTREILYCLYDNNYISLITARDQYPEVMKDTFDWLIDNGILFDNLTQSANKIEVIKKENLDFLIDDYYVTCKNLANNGVDSLLFGQPWNRGVEKTSTSEYKHIKRVKNWKHIAYHINQCKDIFHDN